MTEPLQRVDPKSRTVDGDRFRIRLTNRDPGRHYVLANPNDADTGLQYFLSIGYEIETLRKDGPRFAGMKALAKEGDKVTFNGQVLVSCPIAEYNEREEYKLSHAALVEKRSSAPGGVDGVVGPTGKPAFHEQGKSEFFVPRS